MMSVSFSTYNARVVNSLRALGPGRGGGGGACVVRVVAVLVLGGYAGGYQSARLIEAR